MQGGHTTKMHVWLKMHMQHFVYIMCTHKSRLNNESDHFHLHPMGSVHWGCHCYAWPQRSQWTLLHWKRGQSTSEHDVPAQTKRPARMSHSTGSIYCIYMTRYMYILQRGAALALALHACVHVLCVHQQQHALQQRLERQRLTWNQAPPGIAGFM